MPQLSVIVPTFNEIGNVVALRDCVAAALPDSDWEIVFVDDDSPDQTAAAVRALAQSDPRVRCLQRIGRRGLVSACLEGILASSAPLVAVMDGDLQHDEMLLSSMLRALQSDLELDIVVGSRYVEGGTTGGWSDSRVRLSRLATRLSAMVLKADLKDPMSGFFMIRHATALRCMRGGMSGIGFKILFDLFASSPTPLRFLELPYEFRGRVTGQSKLDTLVGWEYFLVLANRLTNGVVPVRFIAFSMVGGLGLLVHVVVLVILFQGLGQAFVVAQVVATLTAMTTNFLLNNVLTYRDMRLRGWGLVRGWLSFTAACGVGALANVGVAGWLFDSEPRLWLASAIAGVLIGAVWNYAVTTLYTWRKPRSG